MLMIRFFKGDPDKRGNPCQGGVVEELTSIPAWGEVAALKQEADFSQKRVNFSFVCEAELSELLWSSLSLIPCWSGLLVQRLPRHLNQSMKVMVSQHISSTLLAAGSTCVNCAFQGQATVLSCMEKLKENYQACWGNLKEMKPKDLQELFFFRFHMPRCVVQPPRLTSINDVG